MNYDVKIEPFKDVYEELEPLYKQHYAEMTARLLEQGIRVSPYNPRLDRYYKASEEGWLLTFVLRSDGVAVGYSNIYLTNDMHNDDLIAQEDTIFVTKDHRNGIGRRMSKYILEVLKSFGVKRLTVSARTDLRVAKLWKRMGFKETAIQMAYIFED